MHALLRGREKVGTENLRTWLRHGEASLNRSEGGLGGLASTPVNKLSQLNVLQQMEHLKCYPVVQKRIAAGNLKIHGWWFELGTAAVYSFKESERKFVLIDEDEADQFLSNLP
jgi:carbonic anhydrase